MKEAWHAYKHYILLFYFPIYFMFFAYLEDRQTDHIFLIHCPVDDWIPFLPVFIIPYLFWFVYMMLAGFYFIRNEKEGFCRLMAFGILGTAFYLILCLLWPNGQDLRPEVLGNTVFDQMVRILYDTDTPTNVFPSVHVYISIGVDHAFQSSEAAGKHPWIKPCSRITAILIILSTMFLKQHSVIDVLAAMGLAWVVHGLVYDRETIPSCPVAERNMELIRKN